MGLPETQEITEDNWGLRVPARGRETGAQSVHRRSFRGLRVRTLADCFGRGEGWIPGTARAGGVPSPEHQRTGTGSCVKSSSFSPIVPEPSAKWRTSSSATCLEAEALGPVIEITLNRSARGLIPNPDQNPTIALNRRKRRAQRSGMVFSVSSVSSCSESSGYLRNLV